MDRMTVSKTDMEKRVDREVSQLLIHTKLFAPLPRTGLVARPRLIALLQQSARYPLTLVCAPPGYGKTTLLAEWIAGDFHTTMPGTQPVAWLSLDAEDNNLTRFLAYLLAALENVGLENGSNATALLHTPQLLPPQMILAALINDLQAMKHPVWLVMDDYQFIENTTIHESILFLLEHMPASFHLVIATRSDPPLPLHRLRAGNKLLELRAGDLRFTEEEAAAFFRQVMDLSLSREDLVTLENRTEGWVAGLQMAALAMRGLAVKSPSGRGVVDYSAFIRAFGGSHRFILEYLIEEILNRQPANIQAFLLQTSVLDRLCPALCDAVLFEPYDSRAKIDLLERTNLFLTALDEVRCWYRYHHLFADLLRARLAQSQPERIPALHTRASLWYEQERLPEEAIKHALAANDLERAARLVERYTLEMLNQGKMSALLSVIQALPEDLVLNHPGLCIQHAWALTFSGQLRKAQDRLQQAEAQIQPGDHSPFASEVLGNVTIIRGLIAEIGGDLVTAVNLARVADELIPKDDYQGRSVIPYILGDGYFAAGDLERAGEEYAKIRQIGQIAGNLWTSEVALYKLSLVKRLQGRLHAAWELYQEAVRLAEEKRYARAGSMGAVYTGMSELQREWNDLDAARRTVSTAVETMEFWPNPIDLTNAYISLARVSIARRDLARSEEAFQKAEAIAQKATLFPATQASLEDCRVRIWIARADLIAIEAWVNSRASEAANTDPGRKLNPIAGRERLTLARALLALGQDGASNATRLLCSLVEDSREAGQGGMLVEGLALLAKAHWQRGDTAAGIKIMRESLTIAQEEGYMRVYLDEGKVMHNLLESIQAEMEAAPTSSERSLLPYLSRIIAAFPTGTAPNQLQKAKQTGPQAQNKPQEPGAYGGPLVKDALIEPLSEREREVLALICQGVSNQEIAETLVVTINTVKKHNNRIFGKLGVTSRVQAVLKARRLGLVQDSHETAE